MIEENKKWYAIPPYQKTEQWKIYNESGEYIANFENRETCERVVALWNREKEKVSIYMRNLVNIKKLSDL